jgi:flagellar capping protein FliD
MSLFSALGIASSLFGLLQSATSKTSSSSTNLGNNADFSTSLKMRMAELQANSINSITSGVAGTSSGSSAFDFLTSLTKSTTPSATLPGLSATGRNLSLFDPESAFTMMSTINSLDVNYKAQFSQLSEMKAAVSEMRQAGQTLGDVVDSTSENAEITSQLQAFVSKYNEWVTQYDGTVKAGGVLAGTQAAEISLHELRQSIENRFNGAMDGFRGLADLGLTIDSMTRLATLDASKLDAALATNKAGAVNTIDEFSANFAKSAGLLNSVSNFIPNRLANLDRVIDYISDNKASLQTEFGLGAPAKISDKVAKALAAYNATYRA